MPEIDIWRVANLMLNCYRDEAMVESANRADELAESPDGVDNPVPDSSADRVITTPSGPVH
jgi:hypothetical protein